MKAALVSKEFQLADTKCDDLECYICERKAGQGAVVLSLRGQCSHSNIDRYFVPDFLAGELSYHGHLGGRIWYEREELVWVISVRNRTTRAISQATLNSLALGEHTWRHHSNIIRALLQ